MTVAVPIEYSTGDVIGVLQAETSLRDILDVVSAYKLGKAGYAYVVTRSGDLIAHPNISLVLQQTEYRDPRSRERSFPTQSEWSQAKGDCDRTTSRGKRFSAPMLSSRFWTGLSSLNDRWKIAYEPLYASMLRTSSLLLIGFGCGALGKLFTGATGGSPARDLARRRGTYQQR